MQESKLGMRTGRDTTRGQRFIPFLRIPLIYSTNFDVLTISDSAINWHQTDVSGTNKRKTHKGFERISVLRDPPQTLFVSKSPRGGPSKTKSFRPVFRLVEKIVHTSH